MRWINRFVFETTPLSVRCDLSSVKLGVIE